MGEVGVGDRHGLKKSMIETYLKDAFKTGNVDLLDQCEVREIVHEKNKSKSEKQQVQGVFCHKLGEDGKPSLQSSPLIIQASVVVVSGGSVNSPALLLRTELRNSLCNLNESGMLGRNLRLHPVVGIMAVAPHVVDIWNGAPMTTVSEEVASGRDGSHYGAKIEVPSVLPGFIAGLLPWLDHIQYKELILDMRRAFAFIVLGRDKGNTGEIYLDKKDGRPRINYPLENHDRNSLIDGLVVAARIAAASGAVQIGSSFASMGLRDLPSVRKTGKQRKNSEHNGD